MDPKQGKDPQRLSSRAAAGRTQASGPISNPPSRNGPQVKTVVYDRAGLGKSDPNPRPYRIEDEGVAYGALSINVIFMDPSY